MIRTFLGFDVASSLGWAALEVTQDGERVADTGTFRWADDDRPHQFVDRLAAFVLRAFPTRPPVVGIEDVQFSRYTQAHAMYWRVRTMLEVALSKVNVWPPVYVSPQKVKQIATGKGNAKKPEVCAAARREFGLDLYARDEFDPEGRTKKERKGHEDMADAVYVAVAVARSWTPP